jgi:Holliday junction resolvasome RuvABC endonuclease subunit
MKVLSLDPGAVRMGYAVLEGDGVDEARYWDSGCVGLARADTEPYHEHRLKLIRHFHDWAVEVLLDARPDVVVNELLPVKGFNDMSQALLAATAITTVQTVAIGAGFIVSQMASTRAKAAVTGQARATKAKVRDGVINMIPELILRKSSWTKEFDEPDAIAVGLAYLGYSV